MNKNVVEKTLHSIDNIDRLTDLAAISIYNTSYEALDKYDIMQEHATPEYVNEEFIQESVLAGVLIGAGIIGVAVSAFFIIKKIIDSGAKGDKSKKDSSPVAGVDLTKPEEAKKFLTAKVEEIKKWTEGSKTTIKHTYNKANASAIADKIKAFSNAMVAVIDANGAEDIQKATDALNNLDPALPELLETKEQVIDKTTDLFDLVEIECFTILAEAYKELEKRVADVEKQMKNKTKKEGATEETEAVDAELQKTVKEKCNQFTNNVAKVIKDERSWMEELQTAVHNVQQVPAPAKEEPANATPEQQSDAAQPAAQQQASPTNPTGGNPQSSNPGNINTQTQAAYDANLNGTGDINVRGNTAKLNAVDLGSDQAVGRNSNMESISTGGAKNEIELNDAEKAQLPKAMADLKQFYDMYKRTGQTPAEDKLLGHLIQKKYTANVAKTALDEFNTQQSLAAQDGTSMPSSMPSVGDSTTDEEKAAAIANINKIISNTNIRAKYLIEARKFHIDDRTLVQYLTWIKEGSVKDHLTEMVLSNENEENIKQAYAAINGVMTILKLTQAQKEALDCSFDINDVLALKQSGENNNFDAIDTIVKANKKAGKSSGEIKGMLLNRGFSEKDIQNYYKQVNFTDPSFERVEVGSPDRTSDSEDTFKSLDQHASEKDKSSESAADEDIEDIENTNKEPEDLIESNDHYETIYDLFKIELEDAKDLGENVDQTIEKEIAFWKSEYTEDSLRKLAARVKKDLGIASNSDNSTEPEPTPTDNPAPLGFDYDYSEANKGEGADKMNAEPVTIPTEIIDANPTADVKTANQLYNQIMTSIADKKDISGALNDINSISIYSPATKKAVFDAVKQGHPEINVPTVQTSPTPDPTPSSEPTMEPITPPTSEPTPSPSPSPTPTMEPISTPTDQNDNIKDLTAAMEIPKDTSNPMDDAMTTYLSTKIAQDPKRGFTGADLDRAVDAVIARAKEMQANKIDPSKSSHVKNLLHGIYNRAAGSTFGLVGKRLIPGAERKKALQAAKDYAKYKMYSNQVGKYWSEMTEIHTEYRQLIMECNTDIIREEKLKLITEQK